MSNIQSLLQPGTIWLITGERGIGRTDTGGRVQGVGGKTHLAMWLSDAFLEEGNANNDTFVYSNVIVAEKLPSGAWIKTERVRGYNFITSFYDFFLRLSENMMTKPDSKHVLILDEAVVFVGALSFTSVLSQNLTALATLVRKFDLTLIIIAVRAELIIKKLRETQEGLLDGRMFKDSWAIRRWAPHLLTAGYSPKEIVVIQLWDAQPDAFTVDISERLARPMHEGIEKPIGNTPVCCPPGTFAYDTKAAASFQMGWNPYRREKFDFKKIVAVVSEVLSVDAAKTLNDYLRGKTHMREAGPVRTEDVTATYADEPKGESNKKGIKSEIDERLLAGEAPMEIFRDLQDRGLMEDKSFVYRRKRALESEGAIQE